MILTIIVTILVGALVGWPAGKRRGSKRSFWRHSLLGIAGPFVGLLLASLIGISAKALSLGGIIISVLGACLVIWIVRKLSDKK